MKPASQLDPIQLANLQYESVMTPRRGLLGGVQRDIKQGNVQGLLDTAALSTAALPGVGDVAGLLSDGYSIAKDGPNIGNVGGALLGAIPFVPAGLGRVASSIPHRIPHRPMTVEGGASRLHDLTTSFGEDVYGQSARQIFGAGSEGERSVLSLMRKVRNKPNADVTVYRAVPESAATDISPGDWIGLDKKSVKALAEAEEANTGIKQKILTTKVKAKDITSWPDSLQEFGYYPE